MLYGEPMDVVYTWVNGQWPGYQESLAGFAQRPVDLNPNRYRDNLDLLRYSLRSLYTHMPWFRHVYLVTQRPQVPEWLDDRNERLRLVHHDAFMPASALPTFSSYAIVANLCRIPGLSNRFLYVEDDTLFLRETRPEHLCTPDGTVLLHAHARASDRIHADDPNANPWNAALANANRVLDSRYGVTRRRALEHLPVLFDRSQFARFAELFAEPVYATTHARFRWLGTVPCEYMFPWYQVHEGLARCVSPRETRVATGYVGLDNWSAWLRVRLALLRMRRPRWACLNDNFGETPGVNSERVVRAFLDREFPRASPLER